MVHELAICLLGLLAAVDSNVIVYTQDMPHTITEEFLDLPASFGPELPADGLRGYLVHGEPPDGCGPLAKPPAVDNITGKWIVIVARYNCNFETKVRNAQAAGFDCAIVHNVNSSELETMSAKNPVGIDIPSVFVKELAGIVLSKEYIYTNGYYIMVNDDIPFNINTHLLLPFAVVVVLCIAVIIVFMIVKWIKDRRRARRHRLPSRSLRKIPTCKFSKGDPYDMCAICLDDYQEGERLRVLPCAHAYHAKCVDPWLTQNRRVCPVCKRRVVSAGRAPAPASASASASDSDDSAPLLPRETPATQGGTFEEQRENPFVRAARFMRRLRARRPAAPPDAEVAGTSEEPETVDNEESTEEERAPLVRASRRRRRGRGARRALSAQPSINAHAQPPHAPHIGVAALPAPPAAAEAHHVDL